MNLTELNKLVIHLPERTDREKHFKSQGLYFPLDNIRVVSGIKHQDPFKGIAQAHLNCIEIARQNEWDKVLIMEDDIYFQGKDKTLPYFNECIKSLPEDWDILLGGLYFSKNLKEFNKYWSSVGEFCGLHFYIVNQKAYDRILEYDFNQHIDRWMNKGNRFKCYVTNQFIATQIDGYSDNARSNTDYKIILAKYKLLS